MSRTDMAFPIQYALTWPRRVRGGMQPLDFAALGSLTFEPPRDDVFPALGLARHAGIVGGTMPAVFNAANEVAVDAFRAGKIPFPGIWRTVEAVMEAHQPDQSADLGIILAADAEARRLAAQQLG